uniref:Uncharacterized protein n=1 Tax=viral metagenome TaxID=1070528 RepID=A0A6C0HIC4_9ZZZZ
MSYIDAINNVQINYNILTSTTAEITGGGSTISPHTDFSMIIPSSVTDGINVYSVVSVGNNAFKNVDPGHFHLKNVTLPSTVTNIGENAFRGNGQMQINLDYVETIGVEAFADCQQMHKYTNGIITLSGRTKIIGNAAFANINCSSIVIRNDGYNNNLTINYAAFYSNANLISLVIHPRPVISFGVWICHNCPNLTSIIFPNGVTTISDNFAITCPNVQKVYLYGSVIPTYGVTPFPISNPTFYYLEGATSLSNFPTATTKQVLIKLVSYTLYRKSNSTAVFRVVFENSQTVFNTADFSFNNGSFLSTMTPSDGENKTWNGTLNQTGNIMNTITIAENKYAVIDPIFGWAVSPTTPLNIDQITLPDQSPFAFSAPLPSAVVYNPSHKMVDLLELVTPGETPGGTISFTVDGVPIAGSTLNYAGAEITYTVKVTKSVDNYFDKEYTRAITITKAIQDNFAFLPSAVVYNPSQKIVDLLALVSGGTPGGSFSFTVDGVAIAGSTMNYTDARTYTIIATKTVDNYYSIQSSPQTITITNATQPFYRFIDSELFIPSNPDNNTVALSTILSGKTEGGHESATLSFSGVGVSGDILTYTGEGSYTIFATKKYPNYNDITASTEITIYNNLYTKTEVLTGPTTTFYFQWTEYANYNNANYGYTLTISNEFMKYERTIPSLGETIRPYISTNRSSIVDLSRNSSRTTITFESMATISNIVVYPVAKIIENFNGSLIDISMSNHFNETLNSYTHTSSIYNKNEIPLPDISFSNITGYSFSFKPIRSSHYDTYYRILQATNGVENKFTGDNVVQATDLTPDTSYTILTNISYPQPSQFLYPSFQNYEKAFYISTRNESRIASLDISHIRAESIVLKIYDVSNSSDISRFDISFIKNNNVIKFVSLTNSQFPYEVAGLPFYSNFSVVTNHVYSTTGNTYDSSGFSFSTKNQSKVARIPGIVNDLVHRIDDIGESMNLYIKFGSPVGDYSYNTLYFKRFSDSIYTSYAIPYDVFDFDFSGVSGTLILKNQRYSIYIKTTYGDGNTYDTTTFDFYAIQQSVLNLNYSLDYTSTTNPTFYSLINGFMSKDQNQVSVASLYHTPFPYPFSRLAQTIAVELDVKKYSISLWYANSYDSSTRIYYNALNTMRTNNTVLFSVYLEDAASLSPIQNTRSLIRSTSTAWSRFDVSFSLNTKRDISTVNLVIERNGYEYNMLTLKDIRFQQQPENNKDDSVGILRNIFGEESLLYNIDVFQYGSATYDTFSTASEYSVTIKYDNSVAEELVSKFPGSYYTHTLYISSSSRYQSFDITGKTVSDFSGFQVNSQVGFGIYPGEKYELYVQTDYTFYQTVNVQSNLTEKVSFYAVPYQSPARVIYNVSFGYYTLVDYFSRMRQTNLFSQYLDEDMYAVNLCFDPPLGETNTFTNTLHITNMSDGKNIEVNIPSSQTFFTFRGVDHSDISGLYLDTSYQIYISTVYTSGNSFNTSSFVFRIPDVSYTLIYY